MPTRTSKTDHEYPYGHARRVGDRFEVDDKDVPVLLLLGRIDPEEGEPGFVVASTGDYQTREMTAGRGRRGRSRNA